MKNLILTILLVGSAAFGAKDRTWIAGTVVAIEEIQGRVMQASPAQNYVVRTEAAEYTLEHAARTYYTDPPKALFKLGDSVDLSLTGKNAYVRAASVQKKLRVIKTTTRSK